MLRPLLATLLLVSSTAQAARYQDPNFGFSFEQPRIPALGPAETTTAVMMYGPTVKGFISNINVQVQMGAFTVETFQAPTLRDIKTMGWTLLSQAEGSRGGRPTLTLDFQGLMNSLPLRWRSFALLAEDRAFVLTCTAHQEGFAAFEADCQRAIDSFQLR